VDTFEEEIDIDAVQAEINDLEKELAVVRAKMTEKLEGLGIKKSMHLFNFPLKVCMSLATCILFVVF